MLDFSVVYLNGVCFVARMKDFKKNHNSGTILVVEDQVDIRFILVKALESCFPLMEIKEAGQLDTARKCIKNHELSAIIMDCGFPDNDKTIRLKGNRNGLILIKELQDGLLGKRNVGIPIAFNSIELTDDKVSAATRLGKNIKSFSKGDIDIVTGKPFFTEKNTAHYMIKWLESELSLEKITARKDFQVAAKSAVKTKKGLFKELDSTIEDILKNIFPKQGGPSR